MNDNEIKDKIKKLNVEMVCTLEKNNDIFSPKDVTINVKQIRGVRK
ncbi:MAG: hypothetical protein FWF46_09455 [Oscillospiraceae bacterium]|nr:hypothetical protein [Oscillospiraceae bacterium]